MDQTVVNVALPTLSRSFGVPLASVDGVVTAYLVALALVMPASGWIGDRFGAKSVMLGSIAAFTAASALCGVSGSLPELVTFRALQGIGGGLMVPVGMTMVFRAFPPAERIRANRILMVPTLLAPASGPVIGGLLVDGLSWRWIFFINVPVGIAALALGLLLPGGSEHPAGAFDLPGFLLAGAGFPMFMYALTAGSTVGWGAFGVLAPLICGVALLVAFTVIELRAKHPLLQLRIYSDRLFRVTNIQLTLASAGFMSTLFLVPLLLQDGLGFSALHSGLCTFTEALGGMTGIQITSRVYKRVGPRRLMLAGMAGTIVTIGGMAAFAGPSTASWLIPVLMYFTGASFGFAMAPSQTAGTATIPSARMGQASTVLNTTRQAAAAAGVALVGIILGAAHAGHGSLAGFRIAFAVAACLMACGLICSAFVRDADAAATMTGSSGKDQAPIPEAA